MILITGGAYQGKLDFVKKTCEQKKDEEPIIAKGGHASLEQLKQSDIIADFHLWVRKLLEEGKNPYPMVEELLKDNPEVLITLNQLGCGVVPMEKFEREYRETVGRIGCLLAERAEAVYLLQCGIPRKIK